MGTACPEPTPPPVLGVSGAAAGTGVGATSDTGVATTDGFERGAGKEDGESTEEDAGHGKSSGGSNPFDVVV